MNNNLQFYIRKHLYSEECECIDYIIELLDNIEYSKREIEFYKKEIEKNKKELELKKEYLKNLNKNNKYKKEKLLKMFMESLKGNDKNGIR